MATVIKDGREIRTRKSAEVECPKCGAKVILTEETDEWIQKRDGSWKHYGYGPGTGNCCGLAFVDSPWDGLQAFIVEKD